MTSMRMVGCDTKVVVEPMFLEERDDNACSRALCLFDERDIVAVTGDQVRDFVRSAIRETYDVGSEADVDAFRRHPFQLLEDVRVEAELPDRQACLLELPLVALDHV